MEKIQHLRKRIDEVDEQILSFLSERVKLCRAIGAIKKEQGLPVKDSSREKEIFNRVKHKTAKLGLNPSQVEAVYQAIIAMCTRVQESDEGLKS